MRLKHEIWSLDVFGRLAILFSTDLRATWDLASQNVHTSTREDYDMEKEKVKDVFLVTPQLPAAQDGTAEHAEDAEGRADDMRKREVCRGP